jgi:N-acetylglucosamine malate deacetylase 1
LVNQQQLLGAKKLKVLVVSAHPDDVEIACAGTLKKLKDQGADIVSVITVRPSSEDNPSRSQHGVEQELRHSYQLSGFELRIFDTPLHANGRPNLVADNVTMTALSKLIEPCDIAIIPHEQDYHQDHRNTYQLARPLVRKLAKEVWLMHTVPYCHYHTNNTANLFCNIDQQWSFKQKLLECYQSYFTPGMINNIKVSNQYWAQTCGAELAESFTVIHRHV